MKWISAFPSYTKIVLNRQKWCNGYFCISSYYSKMAAIIDGKTIAAEIRAEVREEVKEFLAAGHRAPKLAAILVGENPASESYVRNKINAANEIGIESITKRLPAETKEQEVLDLIHQLNEEDTVDAILVQLPLPDHINARTVCNAVSCEKDVDGFNDINTGRCCLSTKAIVPCTPSGIMELLKRSNIPTFGKNVVIAGRSKIVGMPLAVLMSSDGKHELSGMDATVTVCHRYTPSEELTRFCRLADIVVVAVGRPGLIKADMIKPGACVIDVGINHIKDANDQKKIVGDVDFEEVSKVAGHITPVPGGVGPMTVAMLMRNTVLAAKNRIQFNSKKQ